MKNVMLYFILKHQTKTKSFFDFVFNYEEGKTSVITYIWNFGYC